MTDMNTVKPIYPGAFPLPNDEEDAAPRYPMAPLNLTLGFDLETFQIPIEELMPSKKVPDGVMTTRKFKQILSSIREYMKSFYSATGRPSIDPELMIRMLLIGYCMGIRSERRLCEEVHLNLVYRWFCRLDLDDAVPDHSTFSKNRHGRFRDSDLLRKLFEMTVERCIAEKLVGAEGFAVNASLIRADVHRQRSVPGEEGLSPQAAGRAISKCSTMQPSILTAPTI